MIKTYILKSPRFAALQFDPKSDPKIIDEFFSYAKRKVSRILGDGGGLICLEIEGDYGEILAYPGAWMVLAPNGGVKLVHPDNFKRDYEIVIEGTL